jgi:hypothetical protein
MLEFAGAALTNVHSMPALEVNGEAAPFFDEGFNCSFAGAESIALSQ